MNAPGMLCMLIDKLPGELMKQKGWGNQKKKLAWTWFSRSHQACRRGNKSNKQLIIFKRGTAWVYQASYKVYSCGSKETEELLHQGWWEEWNESWTDRSSYKYKVQILWWKPQFTPLSVLPWDQLTIEIVSWRKTDYVIVVIQKTHQNIQHDHA